MATTGLSAAEISALRRFDTPTVCNAIEIFQVRPRTDGYMDRRIKADSPDLPPMVGYACTATRSGAAAAREGDAVSTLDEQVSRYDELPGPPVMLYQDLGDPPESATFGDVMCSTFQAFGAVGLITSGAGRDIEQVRALDFPTFSNGTICSHGYNHAVDIYVPVNVGGIVVYPGDLLHGDANGVTTIPAEVAGQVAEVCAGIAAAEAVVMDYVKAGSPTASGLAEARAESRAMLDAMTERVATG